MNPSGTNTTPMERLLKQVAKIAVTDEPVLIMGETGVGKGVLSRRLHECSPRSSRPFLELNCAALPEALIESELFGHVKGSFTGAVESKPGLLQTADSGTLFLDEIGELPLGLQAKLLHVLETGRFLPVGGTRHIESDFRLIAASNKNLVKEKEAGEFRADLFFRIAVFVLEVPPLRDRHDEIAHLCDLFLSEVKPGLRITSSALERLLCHPWPGNIRELRNVIRHAALLCEGEEVEVDDLPAWIVGSCSHQEVLRAGSLKDKLECFQACVLESSLRDFDGNLDGALRALGVSRSTFYRKLKDRESSSDPG